MIFEGYIAGIPLDWIVFSVIGIIGLMVAIAVFIVFRGGGEDPIGEDQALIIPEDEHGTLQEGFLVGNVGRSEEHLRVTVPSWLDEEGEGPYTAELEIQKKVGLPYRDAFSKMAKKLWIILDQGDLTVVSFSTLLHGLPKRWDPPYADRRKAGKFLVGRYGGGTLTSMLTSKLGIAVIFGVLMSGALFGFFLTVASGHFH